MYHVNNFTVEKITFFKIQIHNKPQKVVFMRLG